MDLLKRMFRPVPDDMTSTRYHIEQIERQRDPLFGNDDTAVVRSAVPCVILERSSSFNPQGPFCPLR